MNISDVLENQAKRSKFQENFDSYDVQFYLDFYCIVFQREKIIFRLNVPRAMIEYNIERDLSVI